MDDNHQTKEGVILFLREEEILIRNYPLKESFAETIF